MPTIKTTHNSHIPLNSTGNGGDGKMHPFMVPFQDKAEQDISPQLQANQIMADITTILQQNPNAKIALTYSANNDQSEEIISGYNSGNYSINGSNQAATFNILTEMIKQQKLYDQIHILPVSTCLHAGGGNAVTTEIVKRDAQNIAKHLGAGWVVLGLQNQHTQPGSYAIGGGVAAKVWQGPLKTSMDNALQQMTNMVIEDIDITNDPLGLQLAYKYGRQHQEQLELTANPAPFKPIPSNAIATTQPLSLITDCNWQEFNNDNFKFIKNIKDDTPNNKHIGSITNSNNDTLLNITKTGIECPPIDKNHEQEQISALVTSLGHLTNTHNKNSIDPLFINIDGASQEYVKSIMDNLAENKMPIKFQSIPNNSTAIKQMIDQYNERYDSINKPPSTKKRRLL